jgi:hypothetical protein
MGGYGSTRWGSHSKKDTVEDCLKLDIHQLLKKIIPAGMLTKPTYAFLALKWSRGEREIASIGLWLDSRGDMPRITLDYRVTPIGGEPQPIRSEVAFTSTLCRYGSVRWWFQCPRCQKRVGCLYKAPGSPHFRCRHCHDLTYTSAQEAHWGEAHMRALGVDFKSFVRSCKMERIAEKWIKGERLTKREKQKWRALYVIDEEE